MFSLYKRYLKKYKMHVILGPIFKLVEAIFELLVPLIIAHIINEGINSNLAQEDKIMFILKNGGLLILFAVVGLCSTLVCQFFASRASQGFGTALRDDLYAHINTLSFKEIDELTVSSLLTRMNADINNLQVSVAMLIRLVVRAPFIVIGATILSFFVFFYAGIVFLVMGIVLFAVIFVIMYYTVPRNKKAQKKLDDITNITKENLSGSRVVRAFGRSKYEFKRFIDENVNLKDILVKVGKINALLNPLTFIIVNAAIILVLYLSGFEFKLGSIEQGDITSLYNYLLQIQLAIMVVANLVVVFTKASASAARINETFNKKSSIVPGSATTKLDEEVVFEFNDVNFQYTKNAKPAIAKANFKILKNMTVGIIGSTGSGKTTLINLMNRFYDVNSGMLKFYGRDIKDYNYEFVNQNIALVMQKAVLFTGSVKANLAWGKQDLDDDSMIKALKDSMAFEFVDKLENKTDTIIYQGGSNLSGGQRQRLSIARALIKNSDVLILDDSTSALDFKTEKQLRDNIKKLAKTTIIISQRASSIMHSDLILVLDQGNIVGQGKHGDLINSCSVYQEICSSQDLM